MQPPFLDISPPQCFSTRVPQDPLADTIMDAEDLDWSQWFHLLSCIRFLSLTKPSARFLQSLHKDLCTPTDLDNRILGPKELRSKTEPRGTYADPMGNVLRDDTTYRKHANTDR